MYVLDTNVVSEIFKKNSRRANPDVIAWARGIPAINQFLSAVTLFELEMGVLLMERRDPRQGKMLRTWLEDRVLPAFHNRVLAVDSEVARRCAALHVPNPRSYRDSLIAATALTHGMTVVTRNTGDFEATGVALLNPWEH
jgi:hypothetical protein